MATSKKATAADVQVILELYDLRREPEMRKARNWFAGFMPQNADEAIKVLNNFGAPENAWFRQVTSYWDMVASFYLRGAVNQELLLDNCGEMVFIYAKLSPYIKDLRAKLNMPDFLGRVEKVITGSKEGRDRLSAMEKRMQEWAKRMRAAAAS